MTPSRKRLGRESAAPGAVPHTPPAPIYDFAALRNAVLSQLGEIASGSGGALGRAGSFVATHLVFLEKNPSAAEILYGKSFSSGRKRDARRHRGLIKTIVRALERLFRQAKKERSVRPDVDPAMASIHCLGAVQMAYTFWTVGGRRDSLTREAMELYAQFLAGIKL